MLRDFIAGIRNVVVTAVTLAAVGVVPLSACGVKGPLKLPPAPATSTNSPGSPAAPVQQPSTEAAPQPPATRP